MSSIGDKGESVRIYRDRYGVPHVFAETVAGAYEGLGYCAAQDRPQTLILHQFLVQGRLAEKIGRRPLSDDMLVVLNGLRRTPIFADWAPGAWAFDDTVDVDRWMGIWDYWTLANEQIDQLSDRARTAVEAFASGVNRYFDTHDGPEYVERYEPATELAWWAYFEHHVAISFFASNAFAVSGGKTDDGAVWIGGDPHYWFFDGHSEAHISCSGLELAGIWDGHVNLGYWGGTNQKIAMAVTASGIEGATVYREQLDPGNRERYWDHRTGQYEPLAQRPRVVKVLDEPDQEYVVRATHHGPVVAETLVGGLPYAYTVRSAFHEDVAASLDQHIRIWGNETAADFLQHVTDSPFIRSHRLVGDTGGHIGYICNGPAPVRDESFDWSAPVDGTIAATEWGEEFWKPGVEPYALPLIENPDCGFISSANDPPWVTTVPALVPDTYPKYLYPDGWRELGARGARQRQILSSGDAFDCESLTELLLDVYVPVAHLGIGALRAAAAREGLLTSLSGDARRIDALFGEWDGMATVDSVAMTLAFQLNRALPDGIPAPRIAVNGDPSITPELSAPLVKADLAEQYCAALPHVAKAMIALYGAIDVPWGDVHALDRPGGLMPLPGGCNELRALSGTWGGWWVGADEIGTDGVERVDFGSRTIRLTRLAAEGVDAYSLTVSGQTPAHEHTNSPHRFDQAALYAQLRLKRLPLTLEQVEADTPVNAPAGTTYEAREELGLGHDVRVG
jgi:acyl-homoserine-lactone acylase